ncbi:MAG TPA: MarR family transcriptional regulator [Longimicrobiales bacterium]|nr:MarR family transcriptional regulator [Longimicrobiales bacterium]
MGARAGEGATRELAVRLHSAALHLLRRLRREDAAAGLSPARLSALSVLVFGGPRSLGELAVAEQVAPPTMSRLVAALEREGLVTREVDAADRRSIRLAATAAGRRILEEGRERRVRRLESMLAGLGAGDLEALSAATALLERLLTEDAAR